MTEPAILVTAAAPVSARRLSIACSPRKHGSHAAAARARKERPAAAPIACDPHDPPATTAAGADAARRFDINRPGQQRRRRRPGPGRQVDMNTFHDISALHLQASLLLTQAVLPGMRGAQIRAHRQIGSRAMLGKAGRTVYAATKAGMLAMTRVWRWNSDPRASPVNMVAPGPINTGLFAQHNPPILRRCSACSKPYRCAAWASPMKSLMPLSSFCPGTPLRHRAGALRVRRAVRCLAPI